MDRYFGRIDDHDQLKDAIIDRYGVGIKQTTDPAAPSGRPLETYVKQDFAVAVDQGLIEGITLGFGQKVSAALATLFTEPGMRLDLAHDSKKDLTEETEFLDLQRKHGGFYSAIVESDKQSCQDGSSLVFTQWSDGLDYRKLSPADLYVIFGDYIEDDGVVRGVDPLSIEDASAIIINLGAIDVGKNRYLGIAGRSDAYPTGRWVTWESHDGTQLPPDYDSEAIEYEIGGKQANPLSWMAATN